MSGRAPSPSVQLPASGSGAIRGGGSAPTGGPRRHLIAPGHGAHDIGFHDDIGRAADHQQMFDVVAPHQHQPPAAVHGGGVDHRQPRHPAAIGVGAEAVAGESANQPGRDADQRQNGHECEEKCNCLHALSPANSVFFRLPFRRTRIETTQQTANEARDWPNLLIPHGNNCRPAILITHESPGPKRLLAVPTSNDLVG